MSDLCPACSLRRDPLIASKGLDAARLIRDGFGVLGRHPGPLIGAELAALAGAGALAASATWGLSLALPLPPGPLTLFGVTLGGLAWSLTRPWVAGLHLRLLRGEAAAGPALSALPELVAVTGLVALGASVAASIAALLASSAAQRLATAPGLALVLGLAALGMVCGGVLAFAPLALCGPSVLALRSEGGALRALGESRSLCAGHGWSVAGLFNAGALLLLLAALPLGLGLPIALAALQSAASSLTLRLRRHHEMRRQRPVAQEEMR